MPRQLKKSELAEVENGSVRIKLPNMSEHILALGKNYKASVDSLLRGNRGRVFSAIKQQELPGGGASVGRKTNSIHLRHITGRSNVVSELKGPLEVAEYPVVLK